MKRLRTLFRFLLAATAACALLYLSLPVVLPLAVRHLQHYILPQETQVSIHGVQWTHSGIRIQEISVRRPGERYQLVNSILHDPFSASRMLNIQELRGTLDALPESDTENKQAQPLEAVPYGSIHISRVHGDIAKRIALEGSLAIQSTERTITISPDLHIQDTQKLHSLLPDSTLHGTLTLPRSSEASMTVELQAKAAPFSLTLAYLSCSLKPEKLHITSGLTSSLEATVIAHCSDRHGKEHTTILTCSTNDQHRTLCIAEEAQQSFVAFEITLPGIQSLKKGIALHRLDIYDPDSLSDHVRRFSDLPLYVHKLSLDTEGYFYPVTQSFDVSALTMTISGRYNNVHVSNLSLDYQTHLTGSLTDLLQTDYSNIPVLLEADSIDVIAESARCSFNKLQGSTRSLIPLSLDLQGTNSCTFGKGVLPKTSFTCNTDTPDTILCRTSETTHGALSYSFSVPFERLSPKYVVLTEARLSAAALESLIKPYEAKAILTDGEARLRGSFNVLRSTLTTSIALNEIRGNLFNIDVNTLDSTLSLSYTEDGLYLPKGPFTIASLNPGIPVTGLTGSFSLSSGTDLRCVIHDLKGTLFQGNITIPAVYCDQRMHRQTIAATIAGLDLAALSDWLAVDSVQAKGIVDGEMPVRLYDGILSIFEGHLELLSPGGSLSVMLPDSYDSVKIPGFEFSVKTLLSSLELTEAFMTFSYADSTLTSTIRLLGSNPRVRNGYPLKLTISLTQNLAALLKTLSISKFLR